MKLTLQMNVLLNLASTMDCARTKLGNMLAIVLRNGRDEIATSLTRTSEVVLEGTVL